MFPGYIDMIQKDFEAPDQKSKKPFFWFPVPTMLTTRLETKELDINNIILKPL